MVCGAQELQSKKKAPRGEAGQGGERRSFGLIGGDDGKDQLRAGERLGALPAALDPRRGIVGALGVAHGARRTNRS